MVNFMIDAPTRILLLEDDPADALLFERILRGTTAARYSVATAARLSEIRPLLGGQRPDIVVLDLNLPDGKGLQNLRRVMEEVPGTPVIVLTGSADEETGIRALQGGAQDYLVKDQIDSKSLPRALRYALERHRLQVALTSQSLTDDLTHLSNRRGFLSLAQRHLDLARRSHSSHLLLYADLEGLQQINETLGYEDGDHALREAAHVLKCSFRDTDVLARLGGDEFGVLAIDAGPANAEVLQQRIQKEIETRNMTPGRRFRLSLTLSVQRWTSQENPYVGGWIDRTDAAMKEERLARRAARNPVLISQAQQSLSSGSANDGRNELRRSV
jgi:two-component system cell cycle response regulator